MPRTADTGGPRFTVVNGVIAPVDSSYIHNMRTPDSGAKATGGAKKTPPPVTTRVSDPTGGSGSQDDPGGPQGGPPTDGSGTTPPPGDAPSVTDYSTMLGIYGLPPDVQGKVNAIFAQNHDVNQATQIALAYIRGTSWYAQTYPGIQEGMARGIISNEADYRNYLNNVNLLSQQYNGRDVSGQELAGYLQQGFSVDRISRLYQGGAIAGVNAGDWNQISGSYGEDGQFTAAERNALGQEQAGIDTELGQKVQRRLALAQQRLQTVFSGDTARLSLTGDRIRTSLTSGDQPDVAS